MRRSPLTLRLARVDLLRVLEKHPSVMASKNKIASPPPGRQEGEIILTVSYRDAAKAIGRSKSQVYEVCKGTRKSEALVAQLRLADLLGNQESGINTR